MDRYPELAAFVEAARCQSFSAAARHLGLTPSAVSKLITRLEDILKVRLFVRQARAVALTDEGRSYLPSAQAVVEAMANAYEHGEALRGSIAGTLRVHTMLTFARHQIVPWLPELLEAYPQLRVDLVIGPQFSAVFGEGIDLAIHSGVLPDSSLISRTIASSRWIVCAAPSYLEKHGRPLIPQDLERHTCIGFTFKSEWNVWPFIGPDDQRHELRPRYAATTTQGEVARDLALSGFGIVRLAEFHIGADLLEGRLVPVLADHQDDAKERIQVIYPSRKNVSPRVKTFCDFLEKKLAAQPWAR